MPLTITIDDDLYARVEQYAVERGRTVSEVIEEAVRPAFLPRFDEPAHPLDH